MLFLISFYSNCGVVLPFYPKGTSSLRSQRFFRKNETKLANAVHEMKTSLEKSVISLESRCFSATKWRYPPSLKRKWGALVVRDDKSTRCVINRGFDIIKT